MSDVDSFLAGSGRGSRIFYTFVRGVITLFCRIFWRVHIVGRENIPAVGAFVLAPVHRSNIDTLLACTVTRRRLRYMGKDSLWRNSITAWLFSSLGGFPVSRGTADREALKRCVKVLEAGEPLVLFPEGERKSGDIVQPLFDGAAYVAVRAGVPVIPVGIGGSAMAMPKGSKMVKPVKCVLVIGKPISTSRDDSSKAARSTVKEVSQVLHGEIQGLFDEAQRMASADKRSTR